MTAPLDSAVTLAPGNTMLVYPPGMLLTFNGVIDESRCPTNALIQCACGGFARISVRVATSAGQRTVWLETLQSRVTGTVDRHVLRLGNLTPPPLTLDSIPSASYRATLRLTAM